MVHIYNGISLSHQKEFVSTWMGLEEIMLSEISQSRERQLHGFTHLWNIRNSRKIGRRRKGGVNRRGNEPGETMDSGKQTEGFRGEGGGGLG